MKMLLLSNFLTIISTGYYVLGATLPDSDASTPAIPTDLCDSKVFCTGELLRTVQLAEVFTDSKTFVDHYQLQDTNVTLKNFEKFMKEHSRTPTKEQTAQFVKDNFGKEDEVIPWIPSDWQPYPPLFKLIEDENYRNWAYGLNQIWRNLSKQLSPHVIAHPERYSIIPVENGFIVPGGRFQEFYYWDSYWVVEGLLVSGMVNTAKGIILNFLSMVKRFGFVPNGGRVYYLMRSQPPLLIPMMQRYLDFTGDIKFLSENIVLLEKEFSFFQRMKTVNVTKNGKTYKMARYIVESEGPRPESYREDYSLAQDLATDELKSEFYKNLKAGAESGWDYSSRWFIKDDGSISHNLSDIATSSIIPVDLNAFLERNARLLSQFNVILCNYIKAKSYRNIALQYREAIDKVLWNDEAGIWLDYDMKNGKPRNAFYPSNLTPLYTGSFDAKQKEFLAEKAVEYLKTSKIADYLGGIPTSVQITGQQWDAPNAWPPLQSIVIQGLRNTESEPALTVAKELAHRWLSSNYVGYTGTGEMYEKYDSTHPGKYGGGGEYVVQAGFGWTNGVVLEFLHTYPEMSPTGDTYTYKHEKTDDSLSVVHLLPKRFSD